MMESLLIPVRDSLARGMTVLLGVGTDASRIRLPAKGAAAGAYVPDALRGAAARVAAERITDAFEPVCGAPLVERAELAGGWMLFHFTDAFYSACVSHLCAALTPAGTDCGSLCLNRMRALARKPGAGCPAERAVQSAFWLLLAAAERPGSLPAAERALLTMTRCVPPAKRSGLCQRCGALADACARVLYLYYAK